MIALIGICKQQYLVDCLSFAYYAWQAIVQNNDDERCRCSIRTESDSCSTKTQLCLCASMSFVGNFVGWVEFSRYMYFTLCLVRSECFRRIGNIFQFAVCATLLIGVSLKRRKCMNTYRKGVLCLGMHWLKLQHCLAQFLGETHYN